MDGTMNRFGRQRGLAMYADWTDRIAAGELPEAPPRPQGMERNVVVTVWNWSDNKGFVHDTISTDKRNPTLNANGLVYSISRFSAPEMNILDPVRHTATGVTVPVRDPNTPFSTPQTVMQPSPYWGDEIIWSSRPSLHNPMMDHDRADLADARDSRRRKPGLLQRRIEPPLGAGVSARHRRAASLSVRSEDQEVHAHRHLLRDPSPAVRRGCQQHALDEQRRR